jgi:DNA ligase (NAD+)
MMKRSLRRRSLVLPLLWLLLTSVPPAPAATLQCTAIPRGDAKHRMSHLEQELRFHNDRYYKAAAPMITDREYDRLFAELQHLEFCFPDLASADSPTASVASDSDSKLLTIEHQRPMLSLSSSTTAEAIEALLKRAKGFEEHPSFLLQPKVDGLPIELVYRFGKLVSAATRGDGTRGADVTERARQIPAVPQQLSGAVPDLLAVRGEVYADRALMAKAETGFRSYATPRHFAAATLKAHQTSPSSVAALHFFPFELVHPEQVGVKSDQEALRLLSLWGFPVAPDLTEPVSSLEQVRHAYQRYLLARDQLPFAADGIVVKVDRLALREILGEGARAPFWAAAWKFAPETATTVISRIVWTTGRTGRSTPVAEVVPVNLAGVKVARVSLQNAELVQRLRLAAGDTVVIALVGDIIPRVIGVKGKGEAAPCAPTVATTAAQACLTDLPGCREQFLARAVHFVSKQGLNIPGLGPRRMRKLVEARLVRDLPSILRLRPEQLAAVPGFGGAAAVRIGAAIKRAAPPRTFPLLISLGIQGLGPAAARKLAQRFQSLDALLQEAPGKPGSPAEQKVRDFFESVEGRELLRGLREAGAI